MKQCEMKTATGQQCPHGFIANIAVVGDKGKVTINVCQQHLHQITATRSTTETPFAARQRKQQEQGW